MVDDCATVITLVSKIIVNRLGSNKIHIASNGFQAMEVLQHNSIDVIICDFEMPQMNGLSLLKQIRKIDKLRSLPFIMMSSKGGREFVLNAIENGVSHYVVKPFSPEKLENAVNKAFNGANKRKAQRYSGLPKHKVVAHLNGQSVEAQVADISRTGMLLRLPFNPLLQLFNEFKLNLEFDDIDDVGFVNLGTIDARIVRVEAENVLQSANANCEVAFYFPSSTLQGETQANMATLIEYLQCKTKDVVNDS